VAGETRERLLHAAATVIRRLGVCALTLDAVAAEAGVSKGGLLYHFPSKEALLDGLIDWWHDQFEESLSETDGEGPGALARAYLRASARAEASTDEQATDRGLLAVFTGHPDRLDPVRRRYEAWQQRLLEDADDDVDATIVRLASDGLWFVELYGLGAPTAELRRRVLERLDAMTRAS
jgi:AcrR family transcriptional regulator